MPPALEIIDLDSDEDVEIPDDVPQAAARSHSQYISQPLIPVIQRSTLKPAKPRQYPEGPLPLRPSNDAPRKARITGRVADEDGVFYTLMVGQIPITEVKVTEILDYVSAWDLEEFENAQFIEEDENRKIAKAAEEAEMEARRLRKLEKIRKKGLIFVEDGNDDLDSNDENEVALGRHGRARPTYTHLYQLPGGGKNGGVRRRRKRDPSTGELMPLSDEDGVEEVGSSDDEQDSKGAAGRSEAGRPSTLVSGLEPPKRRRRKRDPVTGELLPLSGDEKVIPALDGQLPARFRSRSSSTSTMEPPTRVGFTTAIESPRMASSQRAKERSGSASAPLTETSHARSSPARRQAPAVQLELPKRRRRRRDPRTGELLPLDPIPLQVAAPIVTSSRTDIPPAQQTGDWRKRPRRRRHPITGELMPLGWVYDPSAEAASYQVTSDGPSMQELSISRDSKRVRLTSEPDSRQYQRRDAESTSAKSPHGRNAQIVELSESEAEEQDDSSSSMQLSIDVTPPKFSTQVRSPKHGMMQRAPPPSSSSDDEPITLASFLSTTATGKAEKNEDGEETSEDSNSETERIQDMIALQKTSMMNPVASQQNNNDGGVGESDESNVDNDLEEGEFFIERIVAHHWSDPRTHPGLPQTMLYQTKWEGWDDLTWEPAASFPDQSVVEEYRKRVGMKESDR